MTDNYLCIHGHFYQPPRENPWLDAIEYQPSARPYHDWNERITRECYGPNTCSRLHGKEGRILKLINNYEYMSFNFGPTLLSWLEKAHPWVYAHILAADRASQLRYQGHGNALAQVYNHIIMPLAHRRDKLTQIRWGLADFKHRFGRSAEGMWLAETAVDSETLDLMAQEGVSFTILSPTQAQSIRPLCDDARPSPRRPLSGKADEVGSWQDVSGGRIDPTRPYRVLLDKSGRRFMDIFFYNGQISRSVAYENVLASGAELLASIEKAFEARQDRPWLVSVATDGESYGHHYKFGEMALSWLFHHLEQAGHIELTNYALFLERFPPEMEVKLFENSSWSCAHGVERWRGDCGCSVNHKAGWKQAWRKPLREGLDWLAGELAAIFEERGGRLFKDPWGARNDYVEVFPDPTLREQELFLKHHAIGPLGEHEKVEALQLMESQRMSLYMFTSCGWFFDDISGLEATQVLKYASRAMDLVQPWARGDLKAGLIDFLSRAKSNDPAYEHGGQVYQELVKPSHIDASLFTAHYALTALVGEAEQEQCLFSKRVRPVWERRLGDNGLYVMLGEARVAETINGIEISRTYMAVRRGREVLSCLVGESSPAIDPEQLAEEVGPALTEGSQEKMEEVFFHNLGSVKRYSLKDLIPDTRKCIVEGLARGIYRDIKDSMEEHHNALDNFLILLRETGEQAPEILSDLLRLLVGAELTRLMAQDHKEGAIDWSVLRRLLAQVKSWSIALNEQDLKQKARDFLRRQMEHLISTPDHVSMGNMINFLNLIRELNLELDLWECQNIFYEMYNDQKFTKALHAVWFSSFQELGRQLGFLIEAG